MWLNAIECCPASSPIYSVYVRFVFLVEVSKLYWSSNIQWLYKQVECYIIQVIIIMLFCAMILNCILRIPGLSSTEADFLLPYNFVLSLCSVLRYKYVLGLSFPCLLLSHNSWIIVFFDCWLFICVFMQSLWCCFHGAGEQNAEARQVASSIW